MSIVEPAQNLTLNTVVTLQFSNLPLSVIDWIVLSNNSPFILQVTSGSNVLHVPAWYYYPIPLVDGQGNSLRSFTTPFQVTPIQQTIPGTSFTAQLYTTIYQHGEVPPSIVPTPLGGGPIDLTIASSIVNTNQPPAQNIVFAEPSGDTNPSGVTSITNSGFISLGDATYSGKILLTGTHVALAATHNIFPDEMTIIGTSNQLVDILVSGTDASISLTNQANTSHVKLSTVTPVHLVGTTAGSIDMYQDFVGDIKRVILVFNAYRNATANPQVMAIPAPFTKGAQMLIGNINCTMACLAGGVAQNINHYANGAQTVATSVTAGNIAECASAFDSVSFVNSGASNTTCIVTILGF